MLNIEAHHFETIAKLVDLVDLDPSISNHIQVDIFKKPLWRNFKYLWLLTDRKEIKLNQRTTSDSQLRAIYLTGTSNWANVNFKKHNNNSFPKHCYTSSLKRT